MVRGSGMTALVGALAVAAGAFPAAAGAQAVVSPQVVHTGTAPTGYEVTFRIADPEAKRMRIKGEWYFSSEADSSFSPPTSAGRLPSQWRPGDFTLGSPNTTDPNWPVADMVKDAAGVWSYTTPLPSGWFTYQLYKDCDAAPPLLTGCTPMPDPSNPPWGRTSNSVALNSQVYVPSDPAFGSEDYSWQAPAPVAQRGKLETADYPSPQSTAPAGSHDLVVYLPPGYDPNRATPYPLFVLSHGGGENGMGWTTQGVMAPIVDNLINSGKIQPVVIVNTNATGISGGTAGYAADLRNSVFPYMESHYNVAKTPSGRAYAGLSAGGNRGNDAAVRQHDPARLLRHLVVLQRRRRDQARRRPGLQQPGPQDPPRAADRDRQAGPGALVRQHRDGGPDRGRRPVHAPTWRTAVTSGTSGGSRCAST